MNRKQQINKLLEQELYQFDVPAFRTDDCSKQITKRDIFAIVHRIIAAVYKGAS